MSQTDRRNALKRQIDLLDEEQPGQVEQVISALLIENGVCRERYQFIRSLPRIIANHPILVWGDEPCDDNSICFISFGPTDEPVIGVRKGHPNYNRISRGGRAMYWGSGSDYEASSTMDAWLASADVPDAYIEEFKQWCGGGEVFDPARGLEKLSEGFGLCFDHIQDQLRERGLALWSAHPNMNFSFDVETGTIDVFLWNHIHRLMTDRKAEVEAAEKRAKAAALALRNAGLSEEHLLLIDEVRRGLTSTLPLSGAPIQHLRAIEDLTTLTTLQLSGCAALTDVAALAEMKTLETLDLSGCTALTALELRDFPSLKKLNIADCSALTTLKIANCPSLMVETLSGFTRSMAALSAVEITDCVALTALSFTELGALCDLRLAGLSGLTSLLLNRCPSVHALTLTDLPGLTALSLWHCEDLQDLRPLQELSNLTRLDLYSCTAVEDLTPLQGQAHLTEISIGITAIHDLTPLMALPRLTRLNLTISKSFGDTALQPILEALPDLRIQRMEVVQRELEATREDVRVFLPYMVEVGVYRDRTFPMVSSDRVARWQSLASHGDADAQALLGWCHFHGNGVTADPVEATRWFRRAAEQGQVHAQFNLGKCYHNGDGVSQSWTKAFQYYQLAAAQGDAKAQNNMGFCYDLGKGVQKNGKEAVEWYRKAAEQGNVFAQYNMGLERTDSKILPQDLAKAARWFQRASVQGFSWAQNSLGRCYENGKGVEQDLTRAAWWYRKAAEQGQVHAQSHLGRCYENGIGVPQSQKDAIRWYRKAADQGNHASKRALKRLL